MTLPIIRLLQRADAETADMIHTVVRERSVTPERWREICRLLHETRSVEYAMNRAREQAALAKKQLYLFPPSDARDALMAFPDYILARDR